MNLYNVRKELCMGKPLTSMNLKVTYYSRVSTDDSKQHKSLINQVEHFDEMIKNNNNWEYVKGYVDDGISGTSALKRNNFMKMISDAKKGRFDLIVTKEISRFSRNTLDSIKFTRELLLYGVAVLFLNDNINTAMPDSELRLTIMASMAQDEIRRLSERVKFGMNRSIKNGVILGNDLMYGYKKNRNTGNLEIVDNEAMIVKNIFSLYVYNNYSINKISKMLNDNKIKTSLNKKWNPTTIIRMIKNPKYKGFYCGGKTEIVDYMSKKVLKRPKEEWTMYKDYNKVPPIVSSKLWDMANHKLSLKKSNQLAKKAYELSNKLYCKTCSKLFHRRMQCKSVSDASWLCSTYLKEGKKKCNSPNIRESEILRIIDCIFLSLGLDLKFIKDYFNKICNKYVLNIKVLNYKLIRTLLINMLIDKIIISKNCYVTDSINLEVFLKLNDKYNVDSYSDTFEFKRGYNTTGTRRYKVTYKVNLFYV